MLLVLESHTGGSDHILILLHLPQMKVVPGNFHFATNWDRFRHLTVCRSASGTDLDTSETFHNFAVIFSIICVIGFKVPCPLCSMASSLLRH